MSRETANTITWVSILFAIVLLAVIGVFGELHGRRVHDLGIREAITGLVGLLGVALSQIQCGGSGKSDG